MKYIGFYDTEKDRRSMSLAAVNKMNYICGVLNKIGEKAEIIACGTIANNKSDAEIKKINKNTTVRFFKTHKKSKNKFVRIYDVFRQNIILFDYLLKNTKRDEQIMVYHSLGLMRCIYWAKRIKKFRLILEAEEIYNDVAVKSGFSVKMEKKFIECADKYIFPTGLMNDELNKKRKPYILIHGTYQIEADRNVSFDDGKIHVVYAGTFDPRKGGVYASVASGEWLPENYHVHILGFGSEKDTEDVKRQIEETNKKSRALVTYDGMLSGEEYIQFLQKCHIGLSTQNPDADFNATSFPSKILSYIANGLRVITIRIPAIEGSAIGSDVYYYDKQTPEEIAKTIMLVDFDDGYDGREKISRLDKEFINELEYLLNK